jgi:hypothetical protein
MASHSVADPGVVERGGQLVINEVVHKFDFGKIN